MKTGRKFRWMQYSSRITPRRFRWSRRRDIDWLLQRDFEVEEIFAGSRFAEAAQIDGGAALQDGLEIEEAARGLVWRQHPGGEGAAFHFPRIQRILFAAADPRRS